MSVKISPNLPANVVEIGNEITQSKIDEINAGTLATQSWVTSQGYITSAVTVDKALANSIAACTWYAYDTGSDWNRVTNANQYIQAGYNSAIGVTDGTSFVTGLPAVISSLNSGSYWNISVNGTYSDFPVNQAIV